MTTSVRLDGGTVIKVTLDEGTISRWQQPGGMVNRYTKGKALAIAARSRQYAPVKTGALRAGIGVEQSRQVSGRYQSGYDVVSKAPHSVFVIKGTRAHKILPTQGKMLRFTVGGQVVFARSVNHPGTKANDFLTRATLAVMSGVR